MKCRIMASLKDKRPYLRDDWYWSPNDLKRLWAAVLKLAIDDAIDGPPEWENFTSDKAKRCRLDARKWIDSSETGIRSFLWVCQVVELEPSWLRGLVAKAIEEKN